MSIAAIIIISDWNESPRTAIKSVVSNRKYVKELHIVFPAFDEQREKELYQDWMKDKEILLQSDIKVQFDAVLKVEYYDDPKLLLVEIPPNCSMKLGDFELLSSRAKQCNEQQTHLGIGATLNLGSFSLWYGYLVILSVMEWFMNVWFNRKLYQYTDIRARFVMTKGEFKFLPLEHNILSSIWNPYTMKKEYGNATIEPGNMSPKQLTQWVLWSHQTFKFGLWILTYIPIYVFLTISWLGVISTFINFSWIITTTSVSMWIVEFLVSYLIARNYLKVNQLVILCMFFPVYWITFPLVLVWGKFSS
jgi:hypothetical protein